MLIAQHRRARSWPRLATRRWRSAIGSNSATFDRMQTKVQRAEAVSQVKAEMAGDNVEDKLAALEKQDEIEKLLNDIKARRAG